MNYTNEAWEEEQMSNLGCESVADLIRLAKGKQEKPYEIHIWFRAQEGGKFLGEPHVVIEHHDKDDAFMQFELIRIYPQMHFNLGL